MADGRFDDLLLGMAQKHRGIEDLLYTVMSFYERRTDLFHVKEGDSKKGFAPGHAEEALRKQFRHFQGRYLQRAQPHLIATPEEIARATSGGTKNKQRQSGGGGGSEAAATTAAGATPPAPANPTGAAVQESSSSRPTPARIPNGVGVSPLEGGDAGQWEKQQKQGQGYTWNQSVSEITVEIDVEKCSAQDVKVTFQSKRLTVKRKGETVLEGPLCNKINCEESTWHLDSGRQIVLSLEKLQPAFWESLIQDPASEK